jgi:hypothetical protein
MTGTRFLLQQSLWTSRIRRFSHMGQGDCFPSFCRLGSSFGSLADWADDVESAAE